MRYDGDPQFLWNSQISN